MARHTSKDTKSSVPTADGKVDAPASSWGLPMSFEEVVADTNIGSTGVSEVLSAKTPQDALVQTITHPVILAVLVGGALLLLSRR